jgi:cytochrome c553
MKFIAGFIAALIAVAAVALLIMYTGSYNVAASDPDNPIVEWFLSNTMVHSVISRAKLVKAPEQLTEKQAQVGFSIYKNTCVYCHGAPGKDPADIAKGLNPDAPDLSDAAGDMTSIIRQSSQRRRNLEHCSFRSAPSQNDAGGIRPLREGSAMNGFAAT